MTKSANRPDWRRSTRCGNATCVEVAKVGDLYLIRDSKDPDAATLKFTKAEWEAFVAGVKGDDFTF